MTFGVICRWIVRFQDWTYGVRSERSVNTPPTGRGYKGQSKPGAAAIFTQPNFPVGAVGGGASPRDPKGFSMRPLKMAVFPAKGAFS